MDEAAVMERPLIYCHFAHGMGDPKYMPVTNFLTIQRLVQDALDTYNDNYSIMNLVRISVVNYILKYNLKVYFIL